MVKVIISVVLYILLAPVIGGLLSGIDRVISARMQGRVGPSVLQPFYDVMKLWEKEAITVNKVQDFYVGSFLLFVIVTGALFFAGEDILLVLFTLTMASAFLIVAAYSSGSAYPTMAAERELLQMMAYEPMVLMTAIAFYLYTGSFRVSDIMTFGHMPFPYMILTFVGFCFVLTIKFRKAPFDLAMSHHAHQELVGGLKTEFSGSTLAMVEIAHWFENVMLLGMVFLFFANNTIWGTAVGIAACLGVFFSEILIGNTFARMKWSFAFKASWFIALSCGMANIIFLYFF